MSWAHGAIIGLAVSAAGLFSGRLVLREQVRAVQAQADARVAKAWETASAAQAEAVRLRSDLISIRSELEAAQSRAAAQEGAAKALSAGWQKCRLAK